MTDKLERLERHLSEVLAGPRRLMRSLGKHTTGTDAMTDPNSSAYPALHSIDGNWVKEPTPQYGGLTKRELFAMAAMQGMCAAGEYWEGEKKTLTANAVQYADALIAELNKEAP